MNILRRKLRQLIQPIVTTYNLDLRLLRHRLDALGARHAEMSAVLSLDDSPGTPSDRLIDMVPHLIDRARQAQLPLLAERKAPALVHLWPGEHYRLLAAIVQEIRPRQVLEIGTYTGLSALAMVPNLSGDSRLTTVDIIPWSQIPGTFLKDSDLGGRVKQLVCDFADLRVCKAHAALVREADLIFVDAPKDGVFERKLIENFVSLGLKHGALLVFDDIRHVNMLRIWREIVHPKLDLTSFGHWSGTGLVDWAEPDERRLEDKLEARVQSPVDGSRLL